jgi:hypothetical protein
MRALRDRLPFGPVLALALAIAGGLMREGQKWM